MGRYDKIRVYDGSTWKQPTQIRIYQNGTWIDLGANDSAITKSLSVRKGNNFVRATLNKSTEVIQGETYTYGKDFVLTEGIRYCYEKSLGDWIFKATIKKTDNGSKNVYYLGSTNSYIYITWNANGTVTVTNYYKDYSNPYTITTTNAVTAGAWVDLEVKSAKGSANATITFNGVKTTGPLYGIWYNVSVKYKIGDDGLYFKGNMTLKGRDYNKGYCSKVINMSSATDVANNCSGATVHTDTSTTVTWT